MYDLASFPLHRVCVLTNNHEDLRPKDICFTSDSKYVAIIYSEIVSITYVEKKINYRRIAIHRFDAYTGIIESNNVAILNDDNFLVNSFELATFCPGITVEGYRLFITNQYADKVVEILFNPVENTLAITGSYGGNLSFPHGIDISEDGKLLAVTNFGDDHVRIFELDQSTTDQVSIRPHILLCNLSIIGESFGRTVAEGMAARRPVIVYNRGAMSELVADKLTGFLVEPGDLRRVLYWIKWLQQHRTEAIEMGERGRQFVQKTFAFDRFYHNLGIIYKKILN